MSSPALFSRRRLIDRVPPPRSIDRMLRAQAEVSRKNVFCKLSWATEFLIKHRFARNESDDFVLARISDHPDRVESSLHGFDGFFVQAAQQNDALVGSAEMLPPAVIDRALAFL